MEAQAIPTITPLIESADQWGEILVLLPLLVALEVVLSADNAIALAAISRGLKDPARQTQALNLGLALALVFRLGLIATAEWVIDFWPLQLAAAGYLLWLAVTSLLPLWRSEAAEDGGWADAQAPGDGTNTANEAQAPHNRGLASVIATLALTDLAFSLDSVAAAVAVSDRLPLVMTGAAIGVVALRLTAGLFIRWLAVFRHLEAAGYLAVGLVGVRLIVRLVAPQLVPPEWVFLSIVGLLFAWGFSARKPTAAEPLGQAPS